MNITVDSLKRVDLVKVTGRVDSSNAPELDAGLKKLAENGRHEYVLDLSGVEYISSAGLRAMVAALRECKKHNGDLRIAAPSQRVAEVLELAGLTSVFEIYDDAVSAVGSF
ncbi:MAG: STAS domain-containing protein [Chloroflexi bacterium]|nr:STAS domain-containing protein [Chloroflexota bacterium]MCI0576208.1 STAS domain-containing protein [Chloroflexota bacterium]MCI0645498.1 STAS domain-containing protein [Chloroflexota bacterium]MCI0730637.1 STAS domain-containing protein [Chloroflexota bacterium]